MEKYTSLLLSLGAGTLLISGYWLPAILLFICAIYAMKGLLFE
jgi:hypothetical protein